MSEISKAYDPKKVEDKIYKAWEKSGFFNPDNLPGENIKKDKDGKELTYTIVLPPPNITSKLHLGHAAMLAIEDLLIRYHRMKGYRTLWIPGTDHAAIATQNVVEKKLLKEEKLTRHDLGREEFLKKVWEYLKETQVVILNQTRKMGASLDWSREAFTLDKQREKAVRKMFVEMYEAGVIYRGERIVNWCPRCHSTLADDEVEYKEQKAMLYTFKYSKDFPFTIATTRPETKLGDTAVAVNPKDKRYQKYIGKIYEVDFCGVKLKLKIIADRHVEMDFGTGALGVTPAHSMTDWQMAEENDLEIIKVIGEDGKIRNSFKEYSSKTVEEAREMVVAKLRKNNLLEKEEEIENNLSLCYRCGTAIEPLPSKQWFIKVDEPLERLDGKSLKEKAIEVAKDKSIKFIPERFEKRYLDWMENLHDWCISRQIWFGHRIPVWYKKSKVYKAESQKSKVWELKIYGENIFNAIRENKKTVETRAGREKGTGKYWGDFEQGDIIKFSLADEKTDSIVGSVAPAEKIVKKVTHFETIDEMLEVLDINKILPGSSVEEYKKAMEDFPGLKERLEKYGVWAFELENAEDQEIYVGIKPPEGKNWVQDEDSLDTWFSSGMWTFSTLGWPDNFKDGKKINDLAKFHPTQVLETGCDILTLWVSRMIIMSLFALKEIPFENVYLHGMILDKHGKKMSKSKGNGIDPIEMTDKFGTDAVRLSLLIGSTPGNDVRFSEERIEGQRNFVNKLWNISRYIITNYKLQTTNLDIGSYELTDFDAGILHLMKNLIKDVTEDLENYRFSQAGEKLREFTWHEFADWYLEVSKFEKNITVKELIMEKVFTDLLKLWHPFIPFITEQIWSEMGREKMLMIEKWSALSDYEGLDLRHNKYKMIQNIISAIRNTRAENKIEPSKKIKIKIFSQEHLDLLKRNQELIQNMKTGAEKITITKKPLTLARDDETIKVLVDDIEIYLLSKIDKEKEKKNLQKETNNLKKYLSQIENKLNNKKFIANAPDEIVKKEKNKYNESEEKLKKLEEKLKFLSG